MLHIFTNWIQRCSFQVSAYLSIRTSKDIIFNETKDVYIYVKIEAGSVSY